MHCKSKLVILLLFVFANTFGFAQDTVIIKENKADQQEEYTRSKIKNDTFNKIKWIELKKKIKIKDYPEKKIKNKKNRNWEFNISPKWSLILKWILFSLLIAALLFLVLRVLGINPFNKKTDKNKINIALDELEENLDTAAIDPHLYEAIKSKNYKLAIRLYYLMIIQKMALKEKIIWKKYKTNKQYLNELRNKEEYPVLKSLTLTYEKTWFGEKEITENEYDILNKDFVNFLQNIK